MKFFTFILLVVPTLLAAQDEAFIYGKVSTRDGNMYQGAIRWGKEEVYWSDLFNASKEENDNLRHLSSAQRDKLDEQQAWASGESSIGSFLRSVSLSSERYLFHSDGSYIHQFGEIKSIHPKSRRYTAIELQNGERFTLDGEGYNDIGATIHIKDKAVGDVAVEWTQIERVEFMPTPKKLADKFGDVLYGTVETYDGTYSGYVQWDHDERVSTDKLDGDSEDGKLSIPFEKIRSIERRAGHAVVVLNSGRELDLRGSNDVNSDNRGIIVLNKDIPSIDIPWRNFKKVTFTEAPQPIVRYEDFKSQKPLQGKVTLNTGETLNGTIIYDLDETATYELLQGKIDETKFAIPFRNIRTITIKSTYNCDIELVNGKHISLFDDHDVSQRNQGLLLTTTSSATPQYIPWQNVQSISFQ